MPVDILSDILGGAPVVPPQPKTINITSVRADGGTQMRAGLDEATIQEYYDVLYAQERVSNWPFPPIVVFYDGTDYWLGDGFHRLEAVRRLLKGNQVHEIPADIRPGTRRDAILYAASANANHGLRRTNADKRRAVETLLRDPEWQTWSNHEIARRCAVAESSVRNIRAELERTAQIAQSTTRQGADGRTINTANIGRSETKAQQAAALVPTVLEFARTFKTAHGESAQDYYNPYGAAHSNGQFWSAITKHLKAGGIAYRNETLKQAIRDAIVQLKSERQQTAASAPSVVPSQDPGSRHQGAELARCTVCHRPLSDPASAVAGVGPCCAAKRAANAAATGALTLDDLPVADSITVRLGPDGKPDMDWEPEEWEDAQRKLQSAMLTAAMPAVPADLAGWTLFHPNAADWYLSDGLHATPWRQTPEQAFEDARQQRALWTLPASPPLEDPYAYLPGAPILRWNPKTDRNGSIDNLIQAIETTLKLLPHYEQITGIYSHSDPLRRQIAQMVKTLEANRI